MLDSVNSFNIDTTFLGQIWEDVSLSTFFSTSLIVCVCVCVFVYPHVLICVCLCVYTYNCIYFCFYTYIYSSLHLYGSLLLITFINYIYIYFYIVSSYIYLRNHLLSSEINWPLWIYGKEAYLLYIMNLNSDGQNNTGSSLFFKNCPRNQLGNNVQIVVIPHFFISSMIFNIKSPYIQKVRP